MRIHPIQRRFYMQHLSFNCPPAPYLKQIARKHPSAIWTYMMLWDYMDEKNKVYILKSEISSRVLIRTQKFYDDIMNIASQELLNWKEKKKNEETLICIELVGWSNDSDDD
jgi:hypothetical protein